MKKKQQTVSVTVRYTKAQKAWIDAEAKKMAVALGLPSASAMSPVLRALVDKERKK